MSSARKTRAPGEAAGFSLVELMVVVMIVLVITAIAVPSLLHARMKANEAAAVSSMRTIQTAQTLYSVLYPEVGYSPKLAWLGPNGSDCEKTGPHNSCLIHDEALASGIKSGYVFEISGDGKTPSADYTLTANPISSGMSGRCEFSSGQAGEIGIVTQGGSGHFTVGSSGCGE
jgi:prepilin-type N-terminal cleavage/methylation domain-containing protein